MNKEMLYREIGFIDDDIIEEAAVETGSLPKWLWPTTAVCAAVVLCVVCFFAMPSGRSGNVVTVTDSDAHVAYAWEDEAYHPSGEYELFFNTAQSELARQDICLSFSYVLTDEHKEAVFPGLSQLGELDGVAAYAMDGQLRRIFADFTFDNENTRLSIRMYPGIENIGTDYLFDIEPQPSYIMDCEVIAGQYDFFGNTVYFASFVKDGTAYALYAEDEPLAQEALSLLAECLVCGGEADLSPLENPEIPELRNDELTEEQAYSDPDFGAYLPQVSISGLSFESSRRYIDQQSDYLSALWSQWKTQGMDELNITVRRMTEADRARIVTPGEIERYDLSLYPIPRAESVPEELWEVVDDPIFRAEEITIDEVYARSYAVIDLGDSDGPRMRFSVLYGEVLVTFSSKGPTPEQIFELINIILENN